MLKVRIDKISFNPESQLVKDVGDALVDTHPNVKIGESRYGIIPKWEVEIDESFSMTRGMNFFATSGVKQIISKTDEKIVFMTRNSMYELTLLKDGFPNEA